MNEYKDFTSLPPDKESQFVVYEQRSVEASKSAFKIALITSAAIGILTTVIVFSYDKPVNKMAKDDLGMLQRSEPKAEKKPEKTDEKKVETTETQPDEAATDKAAGSETTPAAAESKGEAAPDKAAGEGASDSPASDKKSESGAEE